MVRARRVVWSLVGPGSFALAAVVGARRVPGYNPRDEPISALAATGSDAARVMIPGFLGLAVGSLGLAHALRGSPAAPSPVPVLLALAGVTVGGAGLARCSDRSCPTRMLGDENVTRSDDLHAACSGATFALWIAIPLIAASRGVNASAHYRRTSCAFALTTLAALVVGGQRARRPAATWSGTAQRVMLASALSWYPLAALHAGAAHSPAKS